MAQIGVRAVTLAAAVWLTLIRATVVATAAVLLAMPVQRYLRTAPHGRRRSAAIAAVFITLLTPGMLVAYGYGNFALSLLAWPWLNEAAYAGLLALKLWPWAVGAMVLAPPPPVSQAAMHLLRLMRSMPLQRQRHGSRWMWRSILIRGRGPLRNALLAWAVVFVLAFSDFELASLLSTTSWTVWLFDAQVGGLPTATTLWWATGPLVIQWSVLAAALMLLLNSARWSGVSPHDRAPGRWIGAAAWAVLSIALLIVLVVPGAMVMRQATAGFRTLIADLSIASELWHSLMMASAASAVALALIQWAARVPKDNTKRGDRTERRRRKNSTDLTSSASSALSASSAFNLRLWLLLLLCVPGMLGALAVALALQWAGQQAVMNWAYDTPLLLIVALVVLLLPPGVALWLGIERREPATALHLAKLLRDSPHASQRRAAADLRWALRGRGRWLIAFALFTWAYFELPASAMLAPTGMMPAPARLYNLMHYGHSAVLSAMLALTIVLPLCVLAAASAARGAFRRLA